MKIHYLTIYTGKSSIGMLHYIQPGLLYKCFLTFKTVFILKVIHVHSKKKKKKKKRKKSNNEKRWRMKSKSILCSILFLLD